MSRNGTKRTGPKLTSPIAPTPSTNEEPTLPNDLDIEPGNRTHNVFTACTPISGEAYSDLTGQFLIPASGGNKYVYVLYDYDSNYIYVTVMPSRTKE